MVVKNPIQDALLTLSENQFDTKQAQLDFERARMRQDVYARGAVKGVVSELAEIEMKKQKQRAAIEKSGQSQQNPQAMIPQTVDVTGQTSGRDMSGALKSAAEIAQQVIGGGQARQQGPLGQATPVNPQGTPAGGIFQQSGGTPATGVPPLSPQQGAQPQPPAGASAVPGQTVPAPGQPLSGLERWLGGPLQVIFGAAGRSPGAIVAGLHDIATGQRDTGRFEQLPTVEKMGEDLSNTLWSAQQGFTGAAAALNDQFTRIAGRYGPEVSKQVANAALADAAEIEFKEKQRLAEPDHRLKDQQWRIFEIVETQGIGGLSPGQKMIWDGMNATPSTSNTFQIMMPSTQADIEQQVWDNQDMVQALNEIDRNFYPDYYTLLRDEGQLPNAGRRIYARLGLDLSPGGKEKLSRYAGFDQSLGNISLETAHRLLGAQMTPYELQRFDRAYQAFTQATDAVSARRSLDQLREMVGLSTLRRAHALMMPRTATSNPGDWIKLGDGRDLAINDVGERIDQLVGGGVDLVQAKQQAFWEMKNAYGLDVSHWPEFNPAGQSQ